MHQEQGHHSTKRPRLLRHLWMIGSVLLGIVIIVGTIVLFLTQGPAVAIGTLVAIAIIGIGISSLVGIGPPPSELWTLPLRSDDHRMKAFPRAAQFVHPEQEEEQK